MLLTIIITTLLTHTHTTLSLQFSSVLQYMNSLGVKDGVTGSLDQSVGGVPLSVHLNKIQEIRDIIQQLN